MNEMIIIQKIWFCVTIATVFFLLLGIWTNGINHISGTEQCELDNENKCSIHRCNKKVSYTKQELEFQSCIAEKIYNITLEEKDAY